MPRMLYWPINYTSDQLWQLISPAVASHISQTMLEMRLLGQFDVRVDDQPVEIPSRPAQSLLAYLALNSGKSQRREKLAGMLWPDSDESNARSNLRHALWRLRGTIGDDPLETDNLTVRFRVSQPYYLDVASLEAQVEGQDMDGLIECVSAYQGELLPGFYEDWVSSERERLGALFDRRMQELLALLVAERRWAAVLEWAEHWISRGTVPEQAFRALMRAHHAMGDAAGTAAAYQRLEDGLEKELGVGPSAQSSKLFEELKQAESESQDMRPGLASTNGIASGRGEPALESSPAFLEQRDDEPARTPIVGRGEELAAIDRWLEGALRGSGQPGLIIGEAGRGKTALLEEFSRLAESHHPTLLSSRGICDFYTGLKDPFLPFRQILSTLVGDVEAQWAAGFISREQAERIWRASPVAVDALMEHGRDLIGPMVSRRALQASVATWQSDQHQNRRSDFVMEQVDEQGGVQAPHRNRILEEYTDVIVGLASRRPLLIMLDDLHWIDPSSAALLVQIIKAIKSRPVLLLGTYRPEEIRPREDGQAHPMGEVLTLIKRLYGDVWLDLDDVSLKATRALVDSLVDSSPNRLGDRFRERLADVTAGHPLFITELLRDLKDRGNLVHDEQGRWVESRELNWGVIPARVEGVIEQRTNRLDPELREALSIASVQGDQFTAQVVAQVQGVDPGGLTRRLTRELERQHRLVQEIKSERIGDQAVSEFRFRHILIQRYYYQQLGEGELAYLHQATALALERLYGSDTEQVAHRLARHFAEAGMPERAVEYLVESGRQALRISASQEAVDLLGRALELLSEVDASQAPGPLAAAQIWRYSGEAHYRLGDLVQSRDDFERALQQLGESMPGSRGSLRLNLLLQAVQQVIHRLLPVSLLRPGPEHGPRLREAAYIYKMLAEVYLFTNDILPTSFAALRALNTAERAGPCPELVRSYADMAAAMPLLRMRKLGALYRRHALQTASEVEDQAAEAYAHLATGYYEAGEGNWGQARQSFGLANEFHDRAGDWNRLGIGYDLLANVAILEGDIDEHRQFAQQLLALSERSGSLQHKTWALDNLSINELMAGGQAGLDRVLELAAESMELIEQYPAATEKMTVLAVLAEAHLQKENIGEARRTADELKEMMTQSPPASFALWQNYIGLANIYLNLWEELGSKAPAELREKAAWACKELRSFAAAYPIGRPRSEVLSGLREQLLGNETRARRRWEGGIQSAQLLGMPLEEAFGHYQLGRHLEKDPARSEHLRAAEELYQSRSARSGVELVRSLLRR